jgi:hypothetical protein
MLHHVPRTRPPLGPSRYWNVSCDTTWKQAVQSSVVRLGVHCIRQYKVGKELTSKREVMNLVELFTADWPVLFRSVNNKSLKE